MKCIHNNTEVTIIVREGRVQGQFVEGKMKNTYEQATRPHTSETGKEGTEQLSCC